MVAVIVGCSVFGVFSASALAAPPTLSIDSVTTSSITTAHVSGEVSVDSAANGGQTTYWCFETSEDGVLWSSFCYQGPVQSGESVPVESDLTDLTADTEYQVRLTALNFTDFIEESSATPNPTFTTDPAPNAPVLTLDPPASVAYTSAQISGSIDPEGGNEDAVAGPLPINWELQVNREGEGWEARASGTIEGAEATSGDPIPIPTAPLELTELTPGATYAFRLRATYAGLEALSEEPYPTFVTRAVATPSVTEITTDSATLNAVVNPGGIETSYYFTYSADGETVAVPSESNNSGNPATINPVALGAGEADLDVSQSTAAATHNSAPIPLVSNTTYEVHLILVLPSGEVSSAPATLTTGALAPEAQTGAVDPDPTTAILTGRVHPHHSPTTYFFEYGLDTDYGTSVPLGQNADGGSANHWTDVSQKIEGLLPNTIYHYRLFANNQAGIVEGVDRTFRTTTDFAPAPPERAWEKVTPSAKNGFSAISDGLSGLLSTTGAAVYTRLAGSGPGAASGAQTPLLASRDPNSGWSSQAVDPRFRPTGRASSIWRTLRIFRSRFS